MSDNKYCKKVYIKYNELNKELNKPKTIRIITLAIFIGVGTLVLATGNIVVGLIGIVFGVICGFAFKKQPIKAIDIENVAFEIETGFYQKCIDAGYTDIEKASHIEKIYMLAQKEGFTDSKDDIIALFKRAEKMLKKDVYNKLADSEIAVENYNTKFINYIGKSKSIAMINDMISEQEKIIKECNAELLNIRARANKLYNTSKQHEPNWATHGGIANGIAGGAAGVAVAANTANRAASARAYNDAVATNFAAQSLIQEQPYIRKISDANKKIQQLKSDLEKREFLLVENQPEDELLNKINLRYAFLKKSETGAVSLTVYTMVSPKFTIFENTPAVVDGSIKIIFMNNGRIVGTTYFSIPLGGSYDAHEIKVVCCNVNDEITDIKFEPYHLWAIEKI